MSIREKISRVSTLIPFPKTSLELLTGSYDKNTAMQKIIAIAENDPALTAKILSIANSPFYGFRWNVGSIPQALLTLGIDEVTGLILAYQLKQEIFSWDTKQKKFLQRLWKHSVVTAILARLLKQYLQLHSDGEEFTAGLLHDIGKLVLAQYFPEKLDDMQKKMEKDKKTDLEAEMEVFEMTHTEVGEILGTKWSFPEVLVETMKNHHSLELISNNKILPSVVRLSDIFAEEWQYGIGEQASSFEIDNEVCWKNLQGAFPNLEGVHSREIGKMIRAQLQSSHDFINLFL